MKGKYFPVPVEGQKVVSARAMIEIEAQSIWEGSGTGERYMDAAADGILQVALDYIYEKSLSNEVVLVCGKGNNAGDAYCVGEKLIAADFKVRAYQLFPVEECSKLCNEHAEAFKKKGGEIIFDKSWEFHENELIIDGILGTGFHGKVEGVIEEVIQFMNKKPNPVLAIDIPSGVPGDTGIVKGVAVIANLTAYIGLLKVGHLYNQGFEYVGDLHGVNFGLAQKYVDQIESFGSIVNLDIIGNNLPFRKRTANKYNVGQVLLIAGSPGMPGAAILAAKAALRSGAGMVRLCHPPNMEYELFGCPPEVVRHTYTENKMDSIFRELHRTKAILIGSGLGRSAEIPKVLKKVYKEANCPIVIDGDALYFFEGGVKNAILTPHEGELRKLVHADTQLDLIEQAEIFAKTHNVIIVFKGAPTTIIAPPHPKIIIPFGNKGMASGGMGDALAGIIASLLAQGKNLREAAVLGATIHALAGDKAKATYSEYGIIASDLIDHLPHIFLQSNQ